MPLAAKIFLFLPAVTGVLLSLVAVYTFFGMTRPNSKGPITWPEWAMAIGLGLIVLALHAGYIMAPFALGKSWHATALKWMYPTTVLAAIILASNLRWFIRCKLRRREVPGDALFRGAGGLTFGVVWYLLPTLIMWLTRPATVVAATVAP